MKGLRQLLDQWKPKFEKGGPLGAFHSTFEAFESFLYVPATTTRHGAHIRDCNDMKRVMIVVVAALVPALLFGMYNVGLQYNLSHGILDAGVWSCFVFGFWKVLPLIVVSYVVGLGIEFAFAQARGHEVNEGFLVTGLLIPMIMPVDIPLWMLALATAFSVIVCKELLGGTGMNVFNPALVARAFIFFSYTPFISGDTVWIAGLGSGEGVVDGFSGATVLSQLAENAGGVLAHPSVADWFFGFYPGSIGETSVLAILIGAAVLLYTGVASWRIMLSVFAGGLLMGLIFNLIGTTPYMQMPAYYHLLVGGFAFGAVFMATDPVTAAQTNKGKYIVGLLIGLLAVLLRVVNPGYPEGMMLAILFCNGLAPLVDHYVVQANVRRRTHRVQLAKTEGHE